MVSESKRGWFTDPGWTGKMLGLWADEAKGIRIWRICLRKGLAMPTKLPDDFTVTDRSYTNLQKHGICREFVDWELENFITYFQETGKKKSSWQMTVQRWMRTGFAGRAGAEFERLKDQICSNRPGGLRTDLFERMQEKIKNDYIPELKLSPQNFKDTKPVKVNLPEPPDLGTMTFEQAQAELKKMKIIE